MIYEEFFLEFHKNVMNYETRNNVLMYVTKYAKRLNGMRWMKKKILNKL